MAEPLDTLNKFNAVFYSEPDSQSLRQGDLIDVSKLKEAFPKFKEIYPYFADKYSYCVIASQCCDISKTNTKIKVDCIQLLAVKPFKQVLRDFSKKNSHLHASDTEGDTLILKKKKESKIQETIRDFLNHNTKLHFYYPPPNPAEDSSMLSACLDICVSLRTDAYDKLLKSRVKAVDADYRHKLANKIGELFNRVGLDEFHIKCGLNKDDFALFMTKAFDYLDFQEAEN